MRTRLYITHEGREQSITAWSAELGIPYATIMNRIGYGWPIARVLLPGKQGRRRVPFPALLITRAP